MRFQRGGAVGVSVSGCWKLFSICASVGLCHSKVQQYRNYHKQTWYHMAGFMALFLYRWCYTHFVSIWLQQMRNQLFKLKMKIFRRFQRGPSREKKFKTVSKKAFFFRKKIIICHKEFMNNNNNRTACVRFLKQASKYY